MSKIVNKVFNNGIAATVEFNTVCNAYLVIVTIDGKLLARRYHYKKDANSCAHEIRRNGMGNVPEFYSYDVTFGD